MSGFSSVNEILTATSATSGAKEERLWQKVAPTTVASALYSLWRATGIPVAGADPASLTATAYNASTVGRYGFADPASPATRHLLNGWAKSPVAGSMGTLLLVDRLLAYGNINANVNTLQSFTNVATIPRYTTGDGVMAFLEVTTALGATASNATIIYTNESGTGSRSTGAQTMVVSSVANRIPNAFQWFPLASGDNGIRSVQSIQFSTAMLAGVLNVVLCKPIAVIPLALVGVAGRGDFVTQFPSLPKLEDGHCLQWIFVANGASTTPTFDGSILTAQN